MYRRENLLMKCCIVQSVHRRRGSDSFQVTHQGMVNSIIVEPARAPTPTDSCVCASSPIPEKSTIAPSGTAPKTGSTTDPTTPARDGTSSRSSDPSEIMLDALKEGRKNSTTYISVCDVDVKNRHTHRHPSGDGNALRRRSAAPLGKRCNFGVTA